MLKIKLFTCYRIANGEAKHQKIFKTNKQKVMTMDFPCPVVKTAVPLQKA